MAKVPEDQLELSTWEKIKNFFDKYPFVRDFLIGFGIGVAAVGILAILAATSVITLPAIAITIAIVAPAVIGFAMLVGLFGAIKRCCAGLFASSASDEIPLDVLKEAHDDTTQRSHKEAQTKNTQVNAALDITLAARKAAQLKLSEEQQKEEAALQKANEEAAAKAAENAQKKQIAEAAERTAKELAQKIVSLLENQSIDCKRMYATHHQDADDFFNFYKQDGHSVIGFIDTRCKEYISAEDYTSLKKMFSEFKKQFNIEELYAALIEKSIDRDKSESESTKKENAYRDELDAKSGGFVSMKAEQNFGH